MQNIVIDDPVPWCVCHVAELCKMAERIGVLFKVKTLGSIKNNVLAWGLHAPMVREGVGCSLCQIALATCNVTTTYLLTLSVMNNVPQLT